MPCPLPGNRYIRTVSVRVVVADDNLIAREGILQLLALEPEFEVVAACGDLPEVLEAVDREAPDAVLTDIRMPPSHSDEGIRIANQLRRTHP
jgi:DNA-binding NarL/FixJ family response regulator